MFNTKDLSKEPPRSLRLRMGGYPILLRTIDKGRAALSGTLGQYEYNCGLDHMLFGFKGLDHEELKKFLAPHLQQPSQMAFTQRDRPVKALAP